MPDTKISALTAETSLGDTDELVVASSGATKKITGLNLKASVITAATNATQAELDTHAADTTAVHGITDTAALLTTSAAAAAYQPLDSDLNALAALTTTSFGRALLELANQAALLSAAGAQPSDATLTALAAANWAANALPIGTGADALSQTAFAANTFPARASSGNLVAKTITDAGLALVDDADASAMRTTLGLGTAATHATGDYDAAGAAAAAQAASQPVDSDLTAIAALTTTSYGRAFLALADAAAARTALALGTAAVAATGDFDAAGAAAAAQAASQPLDSDLTAFAGLSIAADKLPYGTGSHTLGLADFTAAGRALIDDVDAAAQRTTLGLGTAATHATGDYEMAGAAAAAQAASQPLDTDLTVIAGLADPNADRLLFWDDSAGAYAYLTASTGLSISGTNLTATGGSGVATDAIFDAKGDLPAGTGADTAAKLTVGANDTVLVADSAQSTGLKYANVAAAQVAASLKPSGSAAASDESLRALGTSSSTACAGNDSRLTNSRVPSVLPYTILLRSNAQLTGAAGTGNTYHFAQSTNNLASALAASLGLIPMLHLVAADYAISGVTTTLLLRAMVAVGTNAPAVTFTIGLYPMTMVANALTFGTVVSGSTAAIASPGANTIGLANSGSFALPSDGPLTFGVTVSGTPSGSTTVFAQLELHQS